MGQLLSCRCCRSLDLVQTWRCSEGSQTQLRPCTNLITFKKSFTKPFTKLSWIMGILVIVVVSAKAFSRERKFTNAWVPGKEQSLVCSGIGLSEYKAFNLNVTFFTSRSPLSNILQCIELSILLADRFNLRLWSMKMAWILSFSPQNQRSALCFTCVRSLFPPDLKARNMYVYILYITYIYIYISYTHVYGVRMYHMTYLFETRECICLEVYPASSSSRQTWTHQSLVICVMLCTSVWMFARGPPVAILRDPGLPWPRSSQLRQYSLPPGGIAEQPLRSSTRGCQGGRSNDAKLHKGYAKITQSPCKARAKIVVP